MIDVITTQAVAAFEEGSGGGVAPCQCLSAFLSFVCRHGTANATRGTSSPPSPGVFNIELTAGPKSRAELMAEMGTGLMVTSLLGSSINPTTGDYSRGASGFWIENGEIAYPVNECTLAGNLRDMLMRITPANDARAHRSYRVPSLLVEGLTLAGE